MKKKKIALSKKLLLDKTVIAELQADQLNKMFGGATLGVRCTGETTARPTACSGRPCC
ncbi:MAG TPA: class I lanthipeptide [Chitinophaga sp.]|uniref:class I lanthipeptide n=1 Tax=Chitinophaga sp. TaxID=1869181 RepID=UPI002B5FF9C7|nr:class I lanthipeptide [Chitinophaga sp.]HVI49290.1 class I lanthipeptide [Chitinophaga sp.]